MHVFLVMESRLYAPVSVATSCMMMEKHAVSRKHQLHDDKTCGKYKTPTAWWQNML